MMIQRRATALKWVTCLAFGSMLMGTGPRRPAGDLLVDLATIGMDTTILDQHDGPFNTNICTDIVERSGRFTDECETACAAHGFTPACSTGLSWEKLVGFNFDDKWLKWGVEILKELQKNQPAGESLVNITNGRPAPASSLDRITGGSTTVACANKLLTALIRSYNYYNDTGCQQNYLLRESPADLTCHVVSALRSCDDVLKLTGPVYAAYVSSGAAEVVVAAAGSCSVGQWAAQSMVERVAEKACMAQASFAHGIAYDRTDAGRLVPKECCYCERDTYLDYRWPWSDEYQRTEQWGSVVSTAAWDSSCEGREGQTFEQAVQNSDGYWTYYQYRNCHRDAPRNGQCWMSR